MQALLALACCLPPANAFAQATPDSDVSPNVSVAERVAASHRAQGVRAGALVLSPRVSIEALFVDNVFIDAPVEESDVIAVIGAGVEARSDWSRHGVRFDAGVESRRYSEFDSESTTDYGAGAGAFFDLAARSRLSFDAAYARGTEQRQTLQTAVGGASPVRFSNIDTSIELSLRQTRFRETIGVSFGRSDFDDVLGAGGATEIDQDFRDNEVLSVYGRQYVRLRPAIEAFAAGNFRTRSFESQQGPGGAVQDSEGYNLSAGLAFDIAKVARGEIGAGYQSENFSDPAFQDVSGASFRGEVEAFITGLTTVTVNFDRAIETAGIIGAGGFYANSVRGRIDHELFRNLLVSFAVDRRLDDFRDIDRKDKATRFIAGVGYFFRPEIVLTLRYDRVDVSSTGADARSDFEQGLVRLGLELRR